MLHDVTVEWFDRAAGAIARAVTQVDADGGDDAASKGAIAAQLLVMDEPFKIVGVTAAPAPPIVEAPAPEPSDAVTRADLLAEAERRGIDVDKRWGAERLMRALEGVA